MQDWFTAREIAEMKLPGLPESERHVRRVSGASGWISRVRENELGRPSLEYPISALPKAAREEYARRKLASIHDLASVGLPQLAAQPAKAPAALTAPVAAQRDARLAILAAVERFAEASDLTLAKADAMFCAAYRAGEIPVADWVRDAVKSVVPRTLWRWRKEVKAGNANRLAVDRGAARKNKGILQTAQGGAVETFILGWLAASPHLSAQIICGYVEEEFGSELVGPDGVLHPLPSVRTFQHVISRLLEKNKVALTKETNPDKYRSTMKLRGTNAYSWVKEPNELWMIDASPVDALCVDGRWTLYAAVDVATRRLIITLSRTPRASAVCLMLRKAMLAWGVPERIKTDNGSDFAAAETQRLLAALAIDPDPSDAYCPDQKGHVESVIGTFQHEVGPQLPGFIGHSVADRKAIEERRSFADRLGCDDAKTFAVSLTAAQLQQHIDDWLEYVYSRRDHSGIGMSPNARAAASSAAIARVDERALDVLLMPVASNKGRRQVTAKGIRVGDHHYINHSIMAGTAVFVRLDPIDMGKIYVFDQEDGRYLGVATCAALATVNPAAYVKAEKAQYEAMVNAAVRPIRAEKKRILKGKTGIERTIALAKRKAAEEDAAAANVIAMPKREIAHETPEILAALDVSRVPEPQLSDEVRAMRDQLAAEPADSAPSANVRRLHAPTSPRARWARARELERRLAQGETLPADETQWLVGYAAGPEYKGFLLTYGPAADNPASAG